MKNNVVTKEKLETYYATSAKALSILQLSIIKGKEKEATEVLEMISCYLSDAKYFQKKGDFVNAFASINYAHGWIDASCRLGIFLVHDSRLFAVNEKERKEKQ